MQEITNTATLFQNQLPATKFFVPVARGTLISRPRLTALLQASLKYPLTLISAPAGFGKTTLLSSWIQSLPASYPLLAWISLDEEDNDPRIFWTSVLVALDQRQPELFSPLLKYLQSSQAPPLKYLLTALINLLAERTEQFLLTLDDYHLITEQQVHTTLLYLAEHLPHQLRIIISTRADPPLPLSQLRARRQVLELRTDQLRCTAEEIRDFFQEVMDIELPEVTVQEVRARTEGWLVGLQLLGLSLRERTDPASLLEEISGDQRYILDYLTEEVLRRQPQEVQSFLLSTCILQHLSASLCDAIMQQQNSRQMLERLEQSNLFIVSLDSKREWYRYHALFAQALCYRLEQTQSDLVPILHYRASLWYAQHDQSTQAVLHAFSAKEWCWAANLIECIPVALHTWVAGERALLQLRDWLEQLPPEVVHARPRLCLTCSQLLWTAVPYSRLEAWLDSAEVTLTALLTKLSLEGDLQAKQEQQNLLGEVITFRAFLQSTQEDGQAALLLCQQALALLSPENFLARALVGCTQLQVSYTSCSNDAVAAVESGLQAVSLAQMAELTAAKAGSVISIIGTTVLHMIGAGRLHEALRLTQQATHLRVEPRELILPEVGWPTLLQADILREWNQLDSALELVEEGISLCKQTESMASLTYLVCGYAVLLRVFLSRGELDAACSALQQFEHIGANLIQSSIYVCSHFTTVDQVRLWLACGELERTTRWAEDVDMTERHGTPLAREREEAAYIRILLAKKQPALALQRLEPVLQRATTGQRWGHVIGLRLLQALGHQMLQQETQALDTLSEAVRLAEPESYICSFVDEGSPMATLLSRLREEQRKTGPTPYLDTLVAAFPQEIRKQEHQPKQLGEPSKAQLLLEPLSERELQVLQLLAHGASNLEIAQELVIVVDTVKRHVSHIFSKLGVQNRVQAVRRARALDLLDEEP